MPEFYKPSLENEDGEKILIPYDRLMKLNDEIMNGFIPPIKKYIEGRTKAELETASKTVIDEKTGMTDLEDWIKWHWTNAKEDAQFNLESELGVW